MSKIFFLASSRLVIAVLLILALPALVLAAAVTNGVTTTSTSNTSSYASASFTPAASDLLVVYVTASATVAAGSMTDSQGLGFTEITSTTKAASADTIYMFVANNLAAASAMTVTFSCSGDSATGAVIEVMRVSGMSLKGSSAIRQSKVAANQTSGTTPSTTFASAALTGNVTVGTVGNASSPATLTPPTSWTEQSDTGYSTPTTGQETVARNSGFTGTAITWGGTSGSAYGVITAELDTTVVSAPTVTTDSASAVVPTAATLFGSITALGSATPTTLGFAISTDSALITGVSTSSQSGSFGVGSFSYSTTTLTANTTYFYRAWANNGSTGYGSIKSFTTGNTTPARKMRLFEGFKIKLVSGKLTLYQQ